LYSSVRYLTVGRYVIVIIEAIAVFGISSLWRVVSFKHTHLVERVGLLTLIVMGEGIIGMTKSVTYVAKYAVYTSGATIGVVVAAVSLIYLLWVLYFDQIEHDRFGTIRQQIWALLHYPLHVAIVLTVEGSTQFITWWIAVENLKLLDNNLMIDLALHANGRQRRHRDLDLLRFRLQEGIHSQLQLQPYTNL
jgi:low temperature requirement protein LtrA